MNWITSTTYVNSKKIALLVSLLFVSVMSSVYATDSETDQFEPYGKPFVQVFYNFHSLHVDGVTASAFEIKRAYIGYKYKFSKEFSVKANIDIGDPHNDSKFHYTAYLKYAYLNYNKNGWSIDIGMMGMKNFDIQESTYWGLRYVEKSAQGLYKIAPYADLGMSVSKKITDKIEADFTIRNGEGYKNPQLDEIYNYGFGLSFEPSSSFFLRAYYDFTNQEESRSAISGFMGYKKSKVKVGLEYTQVVNEKFTLDHFLHSLSTYATYSLNKKFELFARYDHLSSVYAIPQSIPFVSDLSGANASGWNADHDGEYDHLGCSICGCQGCKSSFELQGLAVGYS